MTGDIRIKSGARLTIKCELGMPQNARIYVEKGAKLIVNGGRIYSSCDDTWRGIHVEGNNTIAQGTVGTPIQGYVYMVDASIENAVRGVRFAGESSSGSFDLTTAGGWIRAENSSFLNCQKALEFWKYDFNNKSWLSECDFEVNADYPFTSPVEHITMWDVAGISIKGCDFKAPGNFNDGLEDIAILAYDAIFNVKASTGGTRNHFQGFDKAIDADNTMGTAHSVTIDQSDFIGNNRAITLSSVISPTVTRNKINFSSLNGNYPMGIALYNSFGYHIEGNEINGGADYPIPAQLDPKNANQIKLASTGIYVNHTFSEEYNELYRNDIAGCFWGIYAHGDHQLGTDDNTGLEVLCNDFGTTSEEISSPLPNAWDVYVYGKTAKKQGLSASVSGVLEVQKPAGNRFDDASAINNEGNFDVANNDFQIQNYYHHENPTTNPDEINLAEVFKTAHTGLIFTNRSVACPTNITSGSTHPFPYSYNDKKTLIDGKRSELTYLESNYATTIDNGITSQLLDYLTDFSAPDNQILDYMVAGSPYLSDQVMIGAITRTPAFDQWDLAEILIWNAPLSQQVIHAINQSQPFTPYLYNLVVDQTGSSQRLLLDAELAAVRQEVHQMEQEYSSFVLNDPDLNDPYQKLVDLNVNEADLRHQQLLMWAYIQKSDYNAANSIINNHSTEGFTEIADLQVQVLQSGKNLDELSAAQLNTATNIASDEAHPAYMEARALLALNGDRTHLDPVPEFVTQVASRKAQTAQQVPYTGTALMKIQPNPIQNEAIVKTPLPKEFDSAKLYIYRIDGSLQEVIDLKDTLGFTRMIVRNWKAGIYIAALEVDKKFIEQQKFTVIH